MNKQQTAGSGFSLIDVVVASALVLIVFVGISGAFKAILDLTFYNKAKLGALAVMNEQMEAIRNFDYDSIGTVSGIPSGTIPQSEIVTLNGIDYTRRVLIQYVDAPEDGSGENDENGITADYKRVKIEVSWGSGSEIKKVSSVSNFVPKGIETVAGGGTLIINVINATGAPVASASVHIENNSLDPVVSVDTFTNTEGKVVFPGSPAGGSYEITVTKTGYSTSKTYTADASNPNPSPGHLSVIEGETTVSTFQIDELSSKTVKTYEQTKLMEWEDLFNDSSKISQSASTTVSAGRLELEQTLGVYEDDGYVYSLDLSHSYLNKWQEFSWNDTEPVGTDIKYRVYYYDGTNQLVQIPEVDLPGNSTGFDTSPVDISGLDISTYPSIKIAAFLSTSDTSRTPYISDWKVSYLAGPTPLPDLAFNMTGSKTIGTDGAGDPIYKYSQDLQTNSSGVLTIDSLEWDTYNITIDNDALGLDIGESCDPQPLSLSPGVSTTTSLYFVPQTSNSLLVAVRNSSNELLEGVSVRLYRTGVDITQTSSSCGQTIFTGISSGSVSNGNAYSIDLSLSGYTDTTITDIDVSGASKINVVIDD